MKWYIKGLKQYTDFEGRASRQEFWMFTLVHAVIIIVFLGLFSVGTVMENEIVIFTAIGILGLYALATCIPAIAISVRRLHDIDKSGWYFLLSVIPIVSSIGSIVLIVFYCLKGTEGENSFGPEPTGEV